MLRTPYRNSYDLEAYPAVLINPASTLVLRFGPQVLWRANVEDAVYISRATPLYEDTQ